jgi:predicted amidohydrolase
MRFFLLCLALLALARLRPAADTFDLVLAGGRVMDPATGLDAPRHVGIRGDKIAAISEQPLAGSTVINVTGHFVAPGFIDLHCMARRDLPSESADGTSVSTATPPLVHSPKPAPAETR